MSFENGLFAPKKDEYVCRSRPVSEVWVFLCWKQAVQNIRLITGCLLKYKSVCRNVFIFRIYSTTSIILVTGLVMFTGRETKVMLNSTHAPLKRSSVERTVNRQVCRIKHNVMFRRILLGESTSWISDNYSVWLS